VSISLNSSNVKHNCFLRCHCGMVPMPNRELITSMEGGSDAVSASAPALREQVRCQPPPAVNFFVSILPPIGS